MRALFPVEQRDQPNSGSFCASRPNMVRRGRNRSHDVLTRSGSGAGPAAPPTHPELAAALADCRHAFWSVAAFSSVVNILMLAGPLYMLQVYDRVLTSRSVPTLIALTMLLVGAYGFQACL